MAEIKAFKGIRYNNEITNNLGQVTTPPYDIISKEEQEKYYELNEYNIIRLELGKENTDDNHQNNKYTRAANYLNKWLDSKILTEESEPAIYIYEQTFDDPRGNEMVRTGFICLVKLEDFSSGIILPHEFTLSKPKEDRFNLMSATDCNFSQIFSLFNDESSNVSTLLSRFTCDNEPDMKVLTQENVKEKVWIVKENRLINSIITEIKEKQLFIADGHHRYETALRYRESMIKNNPNHKGDEPYNYVMMMLVDMNDPGMKIFPTHRLVKNLNNFSNDILFAKAQEYFKIESFAMENKSHAVIEIEKILDDNLHNKVFVFYNGDSKLYKFTLIDKNIMLHKLPQKPEAYRELDVTILHELVLKNMLGIDEENMSNQYNLNYTRDIGYALENVDTGSYQSAFFMNPPSIEQIKNVSLADEKMPQKSTYFYPKLLTGLVFNKIKL